MCGICGVLRVRPPGPVDEGLLRRMRDTMIHRGPDDEGVFAADSIGLGFRRLSIIDLASGHQPMANADRSVWIAYNGELYNFRELRGVLESKGYIFRTKSDTEVVLQAYEAFGRACLEYLRGMFAFAIWDGQRSELVLARDRLGIKPLYYTMHEGTFLFASEIKAILQWPGIPRAIDPVALRQYLRWRYVPGPLTMFEGIFKLQAGHVLVVADGHLSVSRYWDLPLDGEVLSLDGAERLLRDRVEECIKGHLVGDVPLGVFLSGGIDSTVVTGMMAGMVPDAVQSFSVGYPSGSAVDETGFARVAATHFRTVHRELILGPQQFWGFLPRLVWHLDEPVADPASIPLYFLSKFARDFVTVVLSGEGADEILAGYSIYHKMMWLERVRRLPWLLPLGLPFVGRKLGRYLEWATVPLEGRYRGVSAIFSEAEVERLLGHNWGSEEPQDFGAAYFDRTAGLDPLKRMLYFDLKVWLPDDLLVKADKMTMATSMELRVPFLDHTLVEWAWRLPSNVQLRGRTGKYLLRRATADLVPVEILNRPKQGFVIPVREWFRDGLAQKARLLMVHEQSGHSLFNVKEVEALIGRHERGREDLSEALFTLVLLSFWHRVFITARAVEAPGFPEMVSHA
jgi:asparagine synthase (glutamine-hydrolysing)